MFSRNEKYGQALHLVYGQDAAIPGRPAIQGEGIFARLKSVFAPANQHPQGMGMPDTVEVTLDRDTIRQAIDTELRNRDFAANQNTRQVTRNETA